MDMKKLILLMFLGVVFFIGGQWLGLEISEKRRHAQGAAAENGSASSGSDKFRDAEID